MAGPLQMHQQHNSSQVANVQRSRRGVEPDVAGDGGIGSQMFGGAGHGVVVHAAPGKFLNEIQWENG